MIQFEIHSPTPPPLHTISVTEESNYMTAELYNNAAAAPAECTDSDNESSIDSFDDESMATDSLCSWDDMNDESTPSLESTETYSEATMMNNDYRDFSPEDFLKWIVSSHGLSPTFYPAQSVPDFFLNMTQENVDAYRPEVVQAVRHADMEELRRLRETGMLTQCCNRFGENIVHTACRRGGLEVLKYLVDECDMSLRIHCDGGRTPLHDACWTTTPNFELVEMLISNSPELLYITDVRGFSPLSYIPQNLWADWCNFLDERRNMLIPKSFL